MSEIKHPQVVKIDPDNTERDLTSPTMRGLLLQGYAFGPAFLWQDRKDDSPYIVVIMTPPLVQVDDLRVREVEKLAPPDVKLEPVLEVCVPDQPRRWHWALWALAGAVCVDLLIRLATAVMLAT